MYKTWGGATIFSKKTLDNIILYLVIMATVVVIFHACSLFYAMTVCFLYFIGVGYVYFKIVQQKKQHDILMLRTLHDAVMSLHQDRHDWMNDLQLLYGYIRMEKKAEVIQCIEQIKLRMLEEGRIAQLFSPTLIFFLRSFRSTVHYINLKIVIEDELDIDNLHDSKWMEHVSQAVIDFLEEYRRICETHRVPLHVLNLHLTAYDDNPMIKFYSEWNDFYTHANTIQAKMTKNKNKKIKIERISCNTMHIQFHTERMQRKEQLCL